MKKFIGLMLMTIVLSNFIHAVGAKDLSGLTPRVRTYLKSVQKGMEGDSQWKSIANISLSTATYNATTLAVSFPVYVVDDNDIKMEWFNDTVSTFSVTNSGSLTVKGGTISSSSAVFNGGSSGLTLTLTGTWAIGDYLTVTLPAMSYGVLSASGATQILTFTE